MDAEEEEKMIKFCCNAISMLRDIYMKCEFCSVK